MSNDNPDAGAPGERAKRPPPTIDLDPSDVTKNDAGSRSEETGRDRFRPWFESVRGSSFENVSGALTPALSGATAAALILTGAWLMGLSGDNRPSPAPAAVTAAPADTSVTDALAARLAKVETDAAAKTKSPAQPVADPALLARTDQIEASLKSVNDTLASLRGEIERIAASAKDAPQRDNAAAPDLSVLDQRFAQIEATQRRLADAAQRAPAPVDDLPIRRAIAANALDLAVRQGEPFAAAFATAKASSPDAKLQPLELFAASGVPSDAALSRELLALLPQATPQPAKQSTSGSAGGGVFDRLQESAAKLVRVERVDAANNEPASPSTAAIAAAARANDVATARRAVMELPAAQRAPMQVWLDKVAARDAAREASRQFAASALAALGKPAP